jgi:enamine deaminase RidA (YjgF/YER057c/UK114 family)
MTDQTNKLRFVNPETLSQPKGYSHVVEARGGRTVYISGQIAVDGSGKVVGVSDFEAQARQAFRNVQLALEAVGMTFDHVVKLGLFVTDVSHLSTLRRVRDEFVNTAQPPASTLLQVAALALPGLLVEVEAIAVGSEDA